MNIIYLDNSSTTRPSDQAVSQMMPYFTDKWGVPSVPHLMGQNLFPAIKESYKAIYDLLGASERDKVIFTSSGAEAVNHAMLSGYFDITQPTGKNQFITSSVDEAPQLMALNRLEQLGCLGTVVQVGPSGRLTKELLGDAIGPRTAMVSLSWANGLTGVIQPVEEISSLCKERGIALHLDATHVLGKLYIDIEEIGADLISFSGDLIHAPKGTGGLYIRAGYKCSPFILGGMEQGGYRAGSLNVPLLAALGVAAKEAKEARDFLCMEVARLRNLFEEKLQKEVPEAVFFFQEEERLPHCTAVGFPGVANEALLFLLNSKKVMASIGGGSFQQIGLILASTGVEETLAHSAVSFSLSRETKEEEIEKSVQVIAECYRNLRETSRRIWKGEDSEYGH